MHISVSIWSFLVEFVCKCLKDTWFLFLSFFLITTFDFDGFEIRWLTEIFERS